MSQFYLNYHIIREIKQQEDKRRIAELEKEINRMREEETRRKADFWNSLEKLTKNKKDVLDSLIYPDSYKLPKYSNKYIEIIEDQMNPNLHPFVGLLATAKTYLDPKRGTETYNVHGTIVSYGATCAQMLLDNGKLVGVHDIQFDNPAAARDAMLKFRR